jgi:hypothetical protein
MSNMFLIIITSITFYVRTIIWNATDMTACKNLSLFLCTQKKKIVKKQAFSQKGVHLPEFLYYGYIS